MVLGSGIDVIEVADVRRELARDTWSSADGIFRVSELRRSTPLKKHAETLAKIFAVKEAVLKALAISDAGLDAFSNIEVLATRNGRVDIRLHGPVLQRFATTGARRILVAAHSTRNLATAMVVLEA